MGYTDTVMHEMGLILLVLAAVLGLAYIVRCSMRENVKNLDRLLRRIKPDDLRADVKETKMAVLRLDDRLKAFSMDVEGPDGRHEMLRRYISRLEDEVKALAKAMEKTGGWLLEMKATVSGLDDRMEKLSEAVEGCVDGADKIPAALRSLDDRGKFLAEGIERCGGKLNSVLEVALRSDDRMRDFPADMAKDLRELLDGVRALEDRGKGFSGTAEALKESALTVEELRRGVEILMERERAIDHRLERMEKLMTDRGAADQGGSDDHIGPADASLPAERESELSREMEEGVMNLLRYAAGKAPGVEVST